MTSSALPKTLFVSRGQGAPGWYRCALPAMALGMDWVGVAGEPPKLALMTGRTERPIRIAEFDDYDVLVIQQPYGVAWTAEIRRLQDRGVKVLFEIDDYVHAVRKMADHDFGKHFGKDVVRTYEINMAAADGLICSTDYLAERYRAFNPRTWVCRNGIDLGRYALTRPQRPTVNIGWAGGTGHRDSLAAWLPVVAETMRENPHTRFVTIGAPVARELLEEFGEERFVRIPFIAIESYPAAMTLMDIALAPAGRNNFFRAKSDLRWLEASALGTPLIADPMVYPEIEDGVTGFHASTPEELRSHLSALVADDELRRRAGEAAKAYVTAHRTIQQTSGDWVAALQDVAAGPVARAA